jgi:DNA-directed RNA polymerase specialized sigma24 family protein
METLEFGYQLMQRRQRLQALANWLMGDSDKAQVAIEKALAKAWRLRDRVRSEAELDPFLHRWFRDALVEGLADPGSCARLAAKPQIH